MEINDGTDDSQGLNRRNEMGSFLDKLNTQFEKSKEVKLILKDEDQFVRKTVTLKKSKLKGFVKRMIKKLDGGEYELRIFDGPNEYTQKLLIIQ